jgi:APA family basic amino acid/polyamine antiporter
VLNPSLLVHQVHLGTAPTWSQVIFALSLAMVAYTGIETVSNMAEEARDPGHDVPRSVNLVLIAVLGVYAGITVVGLSALPVQHHGNHYFTLLGTKYENDPILGVISAFGLHGTLQSVLRSYVGVLAATILLIATNAGLIGISRLSWSLAEHRQLPRKFADLHRRYRTPWLTITVFSGVAIALLIPPLIFIPGDQETNFLGNLYSFGAMLSFTTAHVAVVWLRVKDPNRDRPYRLPFNVSIRGKSIPLTAVVGGIGTFAAWISVVALHPEARSVGIPWMVFGLLFYFAYRRNQGIDARHTYKIIESAIVPLFGTDVNADALRRAAKLIADDGVVEALYVIEVPTQLPPDAVLDTEEQRASDVLEVARVQGRRQGLNIRTRVIHSRNAGASIATEAREQNADVIYLTDDHAPSAERGLGRTASYLLGVRPCRVVFEHVPSGQPHAGEGERVRAVRPGRG